MGNIVKYIIFNLFFSLFCSKLFFNFILHSSAHFVLNKLAKIGH
jgi:hypothetical protein